MRLNKDKRGISLIVLVITIIVMIIIGAAIILSLSGSDIRGKAEEAVSSNDLATAKEIVATARSEWELNYDELTLKYEDFSEFANEKLVKAGVDYVEVSEDGELSIIDSE